MNRSRGICSVMAAALCAAGTVFGGPEKPDGAPSVLTALDVAPTLFFAGPLSTVNERKADWLKKAEAATPPLIRTRKEPVGLVRVEKDPAAFQGWKAVRDGDVASLEKRRLGVGDSFILDFGEHLTGHLMFRLAPAAYPIDAPVRLAFVFAEVPAELGEPFDPHPTNSLARSWMQDEVINVDDTPAEVRLPRRYAFRYAKVTLAAGSPHAKALIGRIAAEAVSSADESKVPPFAAASEGDAAIDAAARRTLRDCMQTVFEDGPKRDRRLWLGDLRLQALANYATFRNFDLVKRCLYLHAGTATDRGLVATCMFERPAPVRGRNNILDYTALFAPTVLEYLEASGDRATAEDLWPMCLRLLEFTLEYVDPDGLFQPPKSWWLFVDWNQDLDRQAAEHAIVLFGLRATLELAKRLGRESEAPFLPAAIERMEKSARAELWDPDLGLFVSGESRQVSWASQAWMVLAGVPDADQARGALRRVMKHEGAQRPVTPYMHHFVVEALIKAGLRDEAFAHLRGYWGGMIARGADTFWEVWVPENEFESPYKTHLINSYCHAWSCTPSFFLRAGAPTAGADAGAEPPAGSVGVRRKFATKVHSPADK
jgi:hypothetical protein